MRPFRGTRFGLAVGMSFAVLWNHPAPAAAATAPALGQAAGFGVLAGASVVNSGPTIVTGDVGVHPGATVSGFLSGIVIGTIHTADGTAATAQTDLTTAYNNLAGQPCDASITTDLAGSTLVPGVYCAPASMT
jgi:hypothetical protein